MPPVICTLNSLDAVRVKGEGPAAAGERCVCRACPAEGGKCHLILAWSTRLRAQKIGAGAATAAAASMARWFGSQE